MNQQFNSLDIFSVEFEIIKKMAFFTQIEQKKKHMALLKLECNLSDNWPTFYQDNCLIEAKRLLLLTRQYKTNLSKEV